MKIATGEIEDTVPDDGKDPAAKALGSEGDGSGRRYSRQHGGKASLVRPIATKLASGH